MRRLLRLERSRDVVVLCLVILGLQQIAAVAVIQAKAWLAPVLIERAWHRTLATGGQPTTPWPWADTWPVARLRAPTRGVDRLVLSGESGNALAFGPGHAMASAALGSNGLAVIGGHRDTHFSFLRHLGKADPLRLQLPDGQWREYRVRGSRIANADREKLHDDSRGERLALVTCYPFDALLAGGPLRYVVEAFPVVPRPAYTPRQRLL
jgi:sortase A